MMDCLQPITLLTYALRPTQVVGVCADVLGDLTLAPLDPWTYLSALGLTCMVLCLIYELGLAWCVGKNADFR